MFHDALSLCVEGRDPAEFSEFLTLRILKILKGTNWYIIAFLIDKTMKFRGLQWQEQESQEALTLCKERDFLHIMETKSSQKSKMIQYCF